jgi:aspartokinase-like uncharacterized kinase
VNLTVVKVGGSLYDRSGLKFELLNWFQTLPSRRILIVPGGGPTADAVRMLDRTHRLGEAASHWLALLTLSVNAHFLNRLLGWRITHHPRAANEGVMILNPFSFVSDDERRPGHLPASWDVTSDSIAARVAIVAKADRLVLLKSVDIPPGTDWSEAAARGWVDPYFPRLAVGAPFQIDAVRLPDL